MDGADIDDGDSDDDDVGGDDDDWIIVFFFNKFRMHVVCYQYMHQLD
jgi:hypothetical protein